MRRTRFLNQYYERTNFVAFEAGPGLDGDPAVKHEAGHDLGQSSSCRLRSRTARRCECRAVDGHGDVEELRDPGQRRPGIALRLCLRRAQGRGLCLPCALLIAKADRSAYDMYVVVSVTAGQIKCIRMTLTTSILGTQLCSHRLRLLPPSSRPREGRQPGGAGEGSSHERRLLETRTAMKTIHSSIRAQSELKPFSRSDSRPSAQDPCR